MLAITRSGYVKRENIDFLIYLLVLIVTYKTPLDPLNKIICFYNFLKFSKIANARETKTQLDSRDTSDHLKP